MARSALTTVLSMGLSAGVVVLSFFGCFTPLDEETGNCQAAAASPNDCIIPKCNADGSPAPEPVPNAEKRVCFRGENEGVCVDGDCALICETQATPCKCASDTACPDDKQCIDWACVAGACISTAIKEGELLDPLETGDCKKSVCQGGNPTSINDDTDVAADIDADCLKPACVDGMPMLVPDDMDTAADMPKDCQKPACMNGVSMPAPDTTDVPDATGCTGFKCSAKGMIEPKPEPLNTSCMLGAMPGVCNGQGDCKLENGTACTIATATDCLSGNCADGVCCDTGCANECKSCNQATKLGECTNIPSLENDLSYTDPVSMTPNVNCSAPFFCNGSGKCLGGFSAPCTTGSGCLGGICAPSKQCLGAKGEPCTNGGQCASGTCTANKCT